MKLDFCEHCKKKKMVLMVCSCGKTVCLKHNSPESHKCERILKKETSIKDYELEATGAFKKIEKI
tara:strand:- start:79 stop:273 length:195 start_codon:yes stop_codon:yes gene_type:complete